MLGGNRSTSRRLTLAAVTSVSLLLPAVAAEGATAASAAAVSAERTAPKKNLTAEQIDLGTLGGANSMAVDVDGTIVVGESDTATGETHAFAYDLAAEVPRMVDLGTLGGGESRASAVSGSIVVGTAETATGDEHAFAYDLSATKPEMLDLGTFGGAMSYAYDVDGSLVVGTADTPDGHQRGFVYDLAAAEPTMVDLGTLGGDSSRAAAIDGSVIAGSSETVMENPYFEGSKIWRAFAYDLAAEKPELVMLGTVHGRFDGEYDGWGQDVQGDVVLVSENDTAGYDHYDSSIYVLGAGDPREIRLEGGGLGDAGPGGMDGPWIVGTAIKAAEDYRAWVYDRSAREPAMQQFVTVPGSYSSANGVSGDIAIGKWYHSRMGEGFAHDLGRPQARTLGLGRDSYPTDIDGDLIVGYGSHGQSHRATAWTLSETRKPMLAFRRASSTVREKDGRVVVRVDRYGRTDRAATVRYRTRALTAEAGKDFVAKSGKLRFRPGVTTRRFKVRVLRDGVNERSEIFELALSRPSKRALLGTPSWSVVTIRNSR